MSEDNSFDQTKNNSDDVNENEQAMPTFGEEENQYVSENEGQSEITIDETLSDYDTSSTIENDPESKDNIERPYFSDNYSNDDFVSDENGEPYQPDAVYSDNSYINDDAKVKKKKQGQSKQQTSSTYESWSS